MMIKQKQLQHIKNVRVLKTTEFRADNTVVSQGRSAADTEDTSS